MDRESDTQTAERSEEAETRGTKKRLLSVKLDRGQTSPASTLDPQTMIYYNNKASE